MTEEQISEFVAATNATREEAVEFLAKYKNDVASATFAYRSSRPVPAKKNEYFAGGSKSGVCVIAPGEEEANATPMPAKKPEPAPSFSGAARTLSSGNPAPAQSPAMPAGPFAAKKTDYTVPGKPKTRIRFELPGGQMLALAVSLDATVGDLKSYIVENYPEAEGKPVTLNVTVPPKTLGDDSETVEAAGLKMVTIKVVC